jgi:hypothetical protein
MVKALKESLLNILILNYGKKFTNIFPNMTVNEIYERIAQNLHNAIDSPNWEKAVLNIEFEGEGVVGYNGDYEDKAEKKSIYVRQISREIRHWIRELRTGKFDVEFIWDQELNDEIERLSKE